MSAKEMFDDLGEILKYINGSDDLLTNNPKVDLFTALLKIKGMIEVLYEKVYLEVE